MTAHEHNAWMADQAPVKRDPLPLHVWMLAVMALSIVADICQIVTSGWLS